MLLSRWLYCKEALPKMATGIPGLLASQVKYWEESVPLLPMGPGSSVGLMFLTLIGSLRWCAHPWTNHCWGGGVGYPYQPGGCYVGSWTSHQPLWNHGHWEGSKGDSPKENNMLTTFQKKKKKIYRCQQKYLTSTFLYDKSEYPASAIFISQGASFLFPSLFSYIKWCW